MLSGVQDPVVLNRDNQTVQMEAVMRDRGVYLDRPIITLGTLVNHVSQQMCGTLTYLSRIRHFLTEEAAKLLVQALILTRL